MEQTLEEGDHIIAEDVEYPFNIDIDRYRSNVLIFYRSNKPSKIIIKRLVGIFGDTLFLDQEIVVPETGFKYVRGQNSSYKLYLDTFLENEYQDLNLDTLWFNHIYLFFRGDNSEESFDSRHYGFIP